MRLDGVDVPVRIPESDRSPVSIVPPGEDLVSVVIPAKDEESSLERCIQSVLAQDHRRLQVVLVVGPSNDATLDIAERLHDEDPRVEVVEFERSSIPGALNRGLARSRARWLMRVDAHSQIEPGYITRALALLREGRWGGVGGRKDADPSGSPSAPSIAAALASPVGVGGSLYHYGREQTLTDHVPFGAYPVDVLRELGGWDESLLANEDYELDYRLRRTGRRLLFDPRLRIRWRSANTLKQLFSQYHRYGLGKASVAVKHPSSVKPRHLAPPLLMMLPLMGLISPWLLVGMATVYGAVLSVEGLRVSRRKTARRVRPLTVALAFATMHVAWGLGFWQGMAQTFFSSLVPDRSAKRHADTEETSSDDRSSDAADAGANGGRPSIRA